jgi:hypothetical protein
MNPPATLKLPLTFLPDEGNFFVDRDGAIVAEVLCQGVSDDKAVGAYMAHAANTLPKYEAALAALKCPACGGGGAYLNRGVGLPSDGQPVPCRKCGGTGRHPVFLQVAQQKG